MCSGTQLASPFSLQMPRLTRVAFPTASCAFSHAGVRLGSVVPGAPSEATMDPALGQLQTGLFMEWTFVYRGGCTYLPQLWHLG